MGPPQVLYNTVARVVPKWDAAAGGYVVEEAQLPFFVDSEWALDSPIAPHTAHLLRLVVYVPPRQHCPLLVRTDTRRRCSVACGGHVQSIQCLLHVRNMLNKRHSRISPS